MLNEKYYQELKKIRGFLVGLNKGLTITEISRKMGINRNSVAKYLDVLVTSGAVEMKVVGSAKLYTISKRMPFSSILNVSSDYVLVLDDESRVTYANKNMLTLERKTLEEISGMSTDHLEVTKHAVPNIQKFIEESLRGKEYSTEFEIRCDHTTLSFRAKFVPGVLENNKKGLIITMNNISDIRQSEEYNFLSNKNKVDTLKVEPLSSNPELPSSPERTSTNYQKYLDLAKEGIWATDESFRTTFANAWIAGMLGYSIQELIGKPIFDFVPAERKEQTKKYLQNLANQNDGQKNFESQFVRKDGSRIFTSVGISPFISENNKFIGALATISDITDRKKAEDALRNSEKFYRTIIETSPNGIMILDRAGRLKMVNHQTARYLGFCNPKDLDGKNLFDFISPVDIETCQKFFDTALEDQNIATTSCTLIKKDCTGFCADLTITILSDLPESREDFIGIITDVTEHKKAVSRIKKSELKYRSLVEEIGAVIFTTDIRGKITYISPVIHKVLGYTQEELVSKHFYALVGPGSRSAIGIKIKESQLVKSAPSDLQMIDKAGNSRWVRLILQPLVHDGKPQGLSGIIEDINDWKMTENTLQQYELKYKIVVEDQTDLICRFAPDFRILFINPAFWKFFSKSESDIVGVNFLDFIPHKFHESLKSNIDQLNANYFVKNTELELVPPKGNACFFHATIRAIVNADGNITEFQIICRDITELRAYFERSQSLLKNLQIEHTLLNAQNEELRKLQRSGEISEKNYRDLYDHVPLGILTLDSAGKVITLNEAASQLIGRPKKDLVEKTFKDFISPEDLETFSHFFEMMLKGPKKQTREITLGNFYQFSHGLKIFGFATRSDEDDSLQCQLVLTGISELTGLKEFKDYGISSSAEMLSSPR